MKAPGINFYNLDMEHEFKISPKIDQTKVYEAVINRLTGGQSIGIFPEGGSHDRTDLLPIKAGVSIMALGAMAKDPKCRISIVACGLKYFRPQSFRSKVIVEFSKTYRIPTELVNKYKINKREACAELLREVERKMRDVTLSAPSYKELKRVYMARDLYMPKDTSKYSDKQLNEIYKRFTRGLNQYRDRNEVKQLLEEIDTYMQELKAFNVQDDEVRTIKINFFRIIINFLSIIPLVLVNLLFSLAGLVILTPLGLLNGYLAEKARKEALASSTVKVIGADVMATKKLTTTVFLYPILCFGFSTCFFFFLGSM